MSRPLGANFKIPHGLSNAMLLPIVTQSSIDGNIGRYADIARHMGYNSGFSDKELATELVKRLKLLNSELKIPNLSEYGVDKAEFESAIPKMVGAAISSGSPANNPRVLSPEEMSDIYLRAITIN